MEIPAIDKFRCEFYWSNRRRFLMFSTPELTTELHFYDPNFARQIRGKPTLEENVRLKVQHGRAVWLPSSHGEDSRADKLETPNRSN